MFKYSDWSVEATKILSRRELGAVLADLAKRSDRSRQARLNRVIFRLACCCGLRASEIARLQLARRAHIRDAPTLGCPRRNRQGPKSHAPSRYGGMRTPSRIWQHGRPNGSNRRPTRACRS
jgi:integrase